MALCGRQYAQLQLEKAFILTSYNSITLSPDGKEMLCVYHGRTSKTGNKRVVFIDRMEVSDDGILVGNIKVGNGDAAGQKPIP
jgi:hypothetical protein